MSKTTKRHFAIFKAEVERLVKLWDLHDWEVRVLHGGTGPSAGGTCAVNHATHIACIRLNDRWPQNPEVALTKEALLDTARHEVCHVVSGELLSACESRYLTTDEEKSACEAVCIRLIRLLPR